MENAELIKALKEDAEWAHANEWETPITLGDHLDAAADALESLQSQLAASQRRERAAVEFIKYLDRNYSGYMAEDERFEQWRGPQEAGKERQNESHPVQTYTRMV